MLLADALKRWEVLRGGRRAILCTGTDEHGTKVQQAAQRQEMAPKALCDANSATFRDLARSGGIACDHFVRTTDEDHRLAVGHFWARLRERGHLYETQRAGWYSVGDEAFVPEALVERRVDPATGRQVAVAAESGAAVEWCEERNYHFRLTALRDRLLRFYADNPEWVTPAARMAEVVDWVRNHLEDLSVSRPVERLDWGIPVPGDPAQTIYVWVDALVNYLTKAGYPRNWIAPTGSGDGDGSGSGSGSGNGSGNGAFLADDGWPADVHVIGKDIVRFHCVYWPALLLALDLPLPRRVLSHAHWLINARKISKSTGNVVNPFVAIQRWGLDPLRYFLLSAGGIADDANYANEIIAQRYKKGLQGGLGNLLSRVVRPTTWNVREAVVAAAANGGVVESGSGSGSGSGATASAAELPDGDGGLDLDGVVNTQLKHLNGVVGLADGRMAELNPGAALREVMEFVFEVRLVSFSSSTFFLPAYTQLLVFPGPSTYLLTYPNYITSPVLFSSYQGQTPMPTCHRSPSYPINPSHSHIPSLSLSPPVFTFPPAILHARRTASLQPNRRDTDTLTPKTKQQTNVYIAKATPWDLAKAGDTANVHRTIYVAAESLRIAGILLQPFMPGKAGELLDRLGVSPLRRALDDARLGADYDYGVPLTDTKPPLFPPLFEDKPDV